MTTTISGSSGIVFPDLTTMQTGQQAVKAWVNFNGTGTVAIRAGYNVSSITDNAVGNYTVNFTTAMLDVNYVVVGTASSTAAGNLMVVIDETPAPATDSVTVHTITGSGTIQDRGFVNVAIFR